MNSLSVSILLPDSVKFIILNKDHSPLENQWIWKGKLNFIYSNEYPILKSVSIYHFNIRNSVKYTVSVYKCGRCVINMHLISVLVSLMFYAYLYWIIYF